MTYQISGLSEFAEKDDYKNGCDPDDRFFNEIGSTFKGESVKELLQEVASFLGISGDIKDSVELNACDEVGRVDFALTVDEENDPATPFEIAQWKKGKKTLYYAVYTGYVEKVEEFGLSDIEL